MQKYQNLLWEVEKECEKWNFEKRFEFDLGEMLRESGLYENSNSKILTGFWIEENIGNNSFVSDFQGKVYVPSLKFVGNQDFYNVGNKNICSLREGGKIVFRDKDEKGDLIESFGLENFILTQGSKTGIPLYIVDNHNWVFYAWAEFQTIKNSKFKIKNYQLVHLDAHKDEAECVLIDLPDINDLTAVRDFTTKLKVSDYISAGIQTGLIQAEFLSLTESKDFVDFDKKFELLKRDSQNIILNVDLDIFAPEVSLIPLAQKVEAIGYFASKADLITFATSPGFIDQELAVEIVKVMLKYL